MNNKLKPCPFCGSTSLKIESKHHGQWSETGTHSITVRCNKCHALLPICRAVENMVFFYPPVPSADIALIFAITLNY